MLEPYRCLLCLLPQNYSLSFSSPYYLDPFSPYDSPPPFPTPSINPPPSALHFQYTSTSALSSISLNQPQSCFYLTFALVPILTTSLTTFPSPLRPLPPPWLNTADSSLPHISSATLSFSFPFLSASKKADEKKFVKKVSEKSFWKKVCEKNVVKKVNEKIVSKKKWMKKSLWKKNLWKKVCKKKFKKSL